MAENLNDGVFWLPADFLDDDIFAKGETIGTSVACFSNGVGVDLNSPTETLTETESDEEDYMAGLTRQMASSFLDADEDTVAFPGSIPKVSYLCAFVFSFLFLFLLYAACLILRLIFVLVV